MRIQGSNGPQIDDVGKYIALWKRAPGGTWLMAAECWNMDQKAAL